MPYSAIRIIVFWGRFADFSVNCAILFSWINEKEFRLTVQGLLIHDQFGWSWKEWGFEPSWLLQSVLSLFPVPFILFIVAVFQESPFLPIWISKTRIAMTSLKIFRVGQKNVYQMRFTFSCIQEPVISRWGLISLSSHPLSTKGLSGFVVEMIPLLSFRLISFGHWIKTAILGVGFVLSSGQC